MAETSAIEWTDATFNPWMGCTKVSPGCDHCYAEARLDTRLHVVGWGAGQPRKRTSARNWREPGKWNDQHAEFFARHGRRRRVFCASLADVFDNEVDAEWRRDLFRLIAATKNLDWLLLTKRIGNAAKMLQETVGSFGFDWAANPWDHVWLGATMVNQSEANRDLPKLMMTPAAKHFVSFEPLLGAVDLTEAEPFWQPGIYGRGALDWVIVGGESGHHARPMHPDWAKSLRDQCAEAGVPFLFKQWGQWIPESRSDGYTKDLRLKDLGQFESVYLKADGSTHWINEDDHTPYDVDDASMVKVGKKAAGRLLNGRTHDGFPEGVREVHRG